jgi:molybdate transport system substrate-binding protein
MLKGMGGAGADYIGPLPGDLNKRVLFSIGLLALSKQPEVARAMMKFMVSPEAAPLLRKADMDPAAH